MKRPKTKGRDRGGVTASPTYSRGLLWVATNDRPQEDSIGGMKYAPAVCLLAHLFNKTQDDVALDIINVRRGRSV